MIIENINIGMVSLGCSKNLVDAERILGLLKNKGFKISTKLHLCDIIIINTCAFIEAAKQESINNILEFCSLKYNSNNTRLKLIVVIGCLAERYKNELKKEIPEIDIIVGLGGNQNIVELILSGLNGDKKLLFPNKDNLMQHGDRVIMTPRHYGYLKIADGCNNKCTYCVIPLIRGNYKSVSRELLLQEAKWLVKQGVKELNIIAQDVTNYGLDIYGKLALPELLRDLCKIDGLKWVRLLYCYPDKITDQLIDVIASEDKIVKYIDIPFQHINDYILKKMNRKCDKKLILNVISKLREKIPNIIIRSTFIVGFPGETDKHFNELLDFITSIKLQRVGCFKYSREEDTVAYKLDNQVEEKIKIMRYNLLMKAQDKVISQLRKQQKNMKLKVLVEGFNNETNLYYGRSYMEAPDIDGYINFDLGLSYNDKLPKTGDFVEIILD